MVMRSTHSGKLGTGIALSFLIALFLSVLADA